MICSPSPAKLNLFLEVLGRRPDGFHDLDSVFLELDFADRLSAAADEPGRISLECDYPGLPTGDGNLVVGRKPAGSFPESGSFWRSACRLAADWAAAVPTPPPPCDWPMAYGA